VTTAAGIRVLFADDDKGVGDQARSMKDKLSHRIAERKLRQSEDAEQHDEQD